MRPLKLRPSKESAFTMIEVLVFAVLLLMGLMALTSTSITVHKLRGAVDERNTARAGMQSVIEEMQRNSSLLYNADPSWSSAFLAQYAAGGIVGDTFDVFGLGPQAGQPSVGTIQVITDETIADDELQIRLGLPVDLDNDGFIDNNDVTATADILPVIVRVAWTGVSGDSEISQAFYVLAY